MANEIPRKARLDLNTPAELAIRAAMTAVEEAGCDPKLTDVVCKLNEAFDLLAAYNDSKVSQE